MFLVNLWYHKPMNYDSLLRELKQLENERKKTIKIINSMYFINPKIRNGQFIALGVINEDIKRVKFKIALLKEKKNDKNSNTH